MGKLVDTPMSDCFVHQDAPTKGGPGTYNGEEVGPFGEYRRTSTPNGPDEKIRDGSVGPAPSGEYDQF